MKFLRQVDSSERLSTDSCICTGAIKAYLGNLVDTPKINMD